MNRYPAPVGHLLAFFTVVVWGTTFISTKLLLNELSPLEIIMLRFTLAWAALFLLSPRPIRLRSLREELCFMGAGLTGLTLYFLLENTALSYTLASHVGIIISAAPLFTALLLWIFGMSVRPTLCFLTGFIIALMGIAALSAPEKGDASHQLIGALLTVGAALSWGGYSVFMAKLRGCGLTTIQVTRKVFFWGVVFSLPVCLWSGVDIRWETLSAPVTAGNLLYLGLVASALCYVTWNKSMSLIGAAATSVYIYLSPVVTLVASAAILEERIAVRAVAAILLILVGLWLSQRGLAQENRVHREDEKALKKG